MWLIVNSPLASITFRQSHEHLDSIWYWWSTHTGYIPALWTPRLDEHLTSYWLYTGFLNTKARRMMVYTYWLYTGFMNTKARRTFNIIQVLSRCLLVKLFKLVCFVSFNCLLYFIQYFLWHAHTWYAPKYRQRITNMSF